MEYIPRIIDKQIDDKMASSGCVWIEGCKWCGKSTTGRRHVKSVVEFQDVDMKASYDMINNTRPSLFLDHERPLMIDEWQMYPVVWDAIRNDVDKAGRFGQFIITGSARPADKMVMHSGTGRISSILMRPMSLLESGESDGKVSLRQLFGGNANVAMVNDLTFDVLLNAIIRGGWPQAVVNQAGEVAESASNYVERLTHEAIVEEGVKIYNPERIRSILRSLARNISSPLNVSTIMSDLTNVSISRATLDKYLDMLRDLYILDNVPAWNGKLRSRATLRTKMKAQLVDPSIAVAALGATNTSLRRDLKTLGLLFESLAMRDLRIYADSLGGKVYYYRDDSDLEVDAIIVLPDGKWGACEIKLGAGYIQQAEKNLLTMRDKIDTDHVGKPSFLIIITGENYSMQLDSGVYVVSVGSLGV